MRSRIKLGYFPEWSGDPTILFSDEQPSALLQFEYLLRDLAAGKINEVAIHNLDFIEAHHNITIVARLSEIDRGMQKLNGVNSFNWSTTIKYWEEFAEMILVLYDKSGTKNGHQYLDCGLSNDIQVVVSLNEYSNDFWTKFG